jgi:hypothetical protein
MFDLPPSVLRYHVKRMLVHSYLYDWTVQGFGMMRTYLSGPEYPKQFRLNIWDSALMVSNVSLIHDHPWRFKSRIINGQFCNIRFVESDTPNSKFFSEGGPSYGDPYDYAVIKTGEGGGPDGERGRVNLSSMPTEIYNTGDTYQQEPTEIHMSVPGSSTITLNDRTRVGDGEHARVFWPAGREWVDAMPRPATDLEIVEVTARALEKWQW